MTDAENKYIEKMKRIKAIFDSSTSDKINDNDELDSLIDEVNDFEINHNINDININLYEEDSDSIS